MLAPHDRTQPRSGRLMPDRDIYSVSRLNREVRRLLEQGFSRIWLEGELSNVARPSSGHLYFSLKDAGAQVRAAMFRNRNRALPFSPEDGMQVLVRGKLSLYEPRGDYQLIVEHMEEAGDGLLQRAFEALKQKLSAEGLFDEAHKRPLPVLPERIGVITSASGAAIRDVLTVLGRRFPAIPVRIYPVPVQGREAAGEIAGALELASRRGDCDVLILTRGGGSLEDLWPFNEENVARAIHACEIPVISAVGHEIDFTIADFVADRRAATPSAAAELVSPDQQEWLQHIGHLASRLQARFRESLNGRQQAVNWLAKHLQQLHPGQTLRQQAQRLDELERRSRASLQATLQSRQASLASLHGRLRLQSPAGRIAELQLRWQASARRLGHAMQTLLTARQQALAVNSRALNAISPLATLERGYAIVSRTDGGILRHAGEVKSGEQVTARLGKGQLLCTVDEVNADA
jgi:exodeoxyribonuclease VII large subunit